MLKLIAYLLIAYLAVTEGTLEDSKEINRQICFKRNNLPTTCKETNTVEIVKRSIESPLTSYFRKLNDKRIIECTDKNLMINVIKAEISNKDKSMCNTDLDLTNSVNCTEKIFSTILATKACNGKNKCDISIDDTFGIVCECSLQKYLDITYKCVEKLDTEVEKIREKRYVRLAFNLDKLSKKEDKSYDGKKPKSSYKKSKYNKKDSYESKPEVVEHHDAYEGYNDDSSSKYEEYKAEYKGYKDTRSEKYGEAKEYGSAKKYGKYKAADIAKGYKDMSSGKYGHAKKYGSAKKYGKYKAADIAKDYKESSSETHYDESSSSESSSSEPRKSYYRLNDNYVKENSDSKLDRYKRYLGLNYNLKQNKGRHEVYNKQKMNKKDYYGHQNNNAQHGDYFYDEYYDEYYDDSHSGGYKY